jgi:hypothetical protein
MKNAVPGESHHKLNRDSLHEFIANLPRDAEFVLQDWLETLELTQLKDIEDDATKCCTCTDSGAHAEIASKDLANIATMAYCAERYLDLDMNVNAALYCIDTLLIGLAVAACIERLKRTGWLVVIGKIGIELQDPRPYRLTQQGLDEGLWSHEPMTLWILGSSLQIH